MSFSHFYNVRFIVVFFIQKVGMKGCVKTNSIPSSLLRLLRPPSPFSLEASVSAIDTYIVRPLREMAFVASLEEDVAADVTSDLDLALIVRKNIATTKTTPIGAQTAVHLIP